MDRQCHVNLACHRGLYTEANDWVARGGSGGFAACPGAIVERVRV